MLANSTENRNKAKTNIHPSMHAHPILACLQSGQDLPPGWESKHAEEKRRDVELVVGSIERNPTVDGQLPCAAGMNHRWWVLYFVHKRSRKRNL